MQRLMMTSDFHSSRMALMFGLTTLLAGCAESPSLSLAQQPTSIAPDITVTDLNKAAVDAYDRGFEAGRRYQHKHDEATADTSLQDSAQPNNAAPAVTTALLRPSLHWP